MPQPLRLLCAAFVAAALAAGCSSSKKPAEADSGGSGGSFRTGDIEPGGLDLTGLLYGRTSSNPTQAGIGVNSFLWRATLDTLDFMPLASADPFGGVILTDWYANPEAPSERFKATVYILDSRLRADGLKVNVFRQTYSAERGWLDAAASADTALKIENAILTRARQLKIATLDK